MCELHRALLCLSNSGQIIDCNNKNVRRAGGWKPFVRAPRVSLVVLRSLGEKGRARPPPELARLFALDKFIFWRVLAFWRTDRDLPHHIATSEQEPPHSRYFD